jgi:hypothetical protein
VRFLRLTTSVDIYGNVPAEVRAPAVVERELSEAIGRPVQTTMKVIWPRESMAGIIRRWMGKYQPDLVLIVVTPFWFAFESVPLKLDRATGRGGRLSGLLGKIGRRAGRKRKLAWNPLFRGLRSVAHRTVGGSTYAEPELVIAEVEKYVRLVRELRPDVALAVYGLPASDFSGSGINRRVEWARARRLHVYRALTAFCAAEGIPCQAGDEEVESVEWASYREADGIHINEAGHRRLAGHQFPVILQAWRQWHGEAR